MEMALRLLQLRLREIKTKLDLLEVPVDAIIIEYWPEHEEPLRIRLRNSADSHYICSDSDLAQWQLDIEAFSKWYKHKQLLLRKF